MKKKTKDRFRNTAQILVLFLNNFVKTFESLFRIILLSSNKSRHQLKCIANIRMSDSCCVLGNGPSLKDDFDKNRVLCSGRDLMCVNMFCLSPFFKILKPRFYFLVDGAYFAPPTERERELVNQLISSFNDVDWEMYVIVSSSSVTGGRLFSSVHNDRIKFIRVNSTEVSGFRPISHWAYKHGWGMPRCQTVVNFALCTAVNMKYNNVYLYGADHTWTRDLFVNEDNVVCYGDRHLYNQSLSVIRKEENFATLLRCFAMMFESHYQLEAYSKSVGVKIWNCSSDTFLDAYDRLKS